MRTLLSTHPPIEQRIAALGRIEAAMQSGPGAEHVSDLARRRLRPRYRRLFWRIFAANAVVLAAASAMAVLILSPGSLSEPVALRELGDLRRRAARHGPREPRRHPAARRAARGSSCG